MDIAMPNIDKIKASLVAKPVSIPWDFGKGL
jgi:hypothetical protein